MGGARSVLHPYTHANNLISSLGRDKAELRTGRVHKPTLAALFA